MFTCKSLNVHCRKCNRVRQKYAKGYGGCTSAQPIFRRGGLHTKNSGYLDTRPIAFARLVQQGDRRRASERPIAWILLDWSQKPLVSHTVLKVLGIGIKQIDKTSDLII